MFFIETSIIDFWFYALLNITLYPRISNKNLINTTSFIIAIYILLTTIYKYLASFLQAKMFLEGAHQYNASGVQDFIVDISFDGLHYSQLIRISNREFKKPKSEQKKNIPLKKLTNQEIEHLKHTIFFNLLFRFQMLFIPVVIISGQNMKTIVCFSFIILEVSVLAYFIAIKTKSKKPIFSSWIYFTSYFLINLIIFLIAVIGLSMNEWHTNKYKREHKVTFNVKAIQEGLNWFVISLIVSSILLEIVKA